MDKKLKAFEAVVAFVNDLDAVKDALKDAERIKVYHTLVNNIKFTDKNAIETVINGFIKFIDVNKPYIVDNELQRVPKGSRIVYKHPIYLDIYKYIQHADKDTCEAIRGHLVVITSILRPDHSINQALTTLNSGSKEDEFIKNMMGKVMETVNGTQSGNPLEAVIGMLNSGLFQDISAQAENGEIDPKKLLGSVTQMIGNLMADSGAAPPNPNNVDEVD
jgi:hypothetical protein